MALVFVAFKIFMESDNSKRSLGSFTEYYLTSNRNRYNRKPKRYYHGSKNQYFKRSNY